MSHKTGSIALVGVGSLLLLAALTADLTGLGDDAGFGRQQTIGTIVGALIAAVGLFLTTKTSRP